MIPLPNRYTGLHIAVLGLGRSGIAAARLLKTCGATVTALDSGTSPALAERSRELGLEGITVVTGTSALEIDARFDLLVLSPGIEETSDLVLRAQSAGAPLIGELELAFTLAGSPVVAITGTNGKTTTTELTVRMLRGAGINALASGNIGTPLSEVLLSDEPDLHVVEVSSFQLESIETFRPKVALWLNLSPNHLDRYPAMEDYRKAKLRIFMNQTGEDVAVIPSDSGLTGLAARAITFSTTDPSADLTRDGSRILHGGSPLLDMEATRLKGSHNAANLMAAFGAGLALGADPAAMAAAITDYTPPAHRCEVVSVRGGVTWINDSKATNLDAMEQAIRSVRGPLILIAGGKDKGSGFAPIAALVRERASSAILIGEMRGRIAEEWRPMETVQVASLEEAVREAATRAVSGSTVLFSPGTSSFDMFRDYIDRGDMFRQLVKSLPSDTINPTTIPRP